MRSAWIPVMILAGTLQVAGQNPDILFGGWSPLPRMAEARSGACAVQLAGGSIMISGGTGFTSALSTVEILSSERVFSRGPSMLEPRSSHTCTHLRDGRVLVTGGTVDGSGSAELFNPETGQWSSTTNHGLARKGATASLLLDGRVLLAGGTVADSAIGALEYFDPTDDSIVPFEAALSSSRTGHAATVLADGRILLSGGSNGDQVLGSIEIFDWKTSKIVNVSRMRIPRTGHSATLLEDGRVLLAGGYDGTAETNSAELFDPVGNTFERTPSDMRKARRGHLAAWMPGYGGIVLAGGASGGVALADSEVYRPVEGDFAPAGSLLAPREGIAGALFADGSLVAAGGRNSNGPQDGCGVFTPPIRLTTTFTNVSPGATVTANVFVSGAPSQAVFTLKVGDGIDASSRLITTKVDTEPTRSYTVPIFVPMEGDITKVFTITARSGAFTASVTVTVRIGTTLTITPPAQQLSGVPGSYRVTLTRAQVAGPATGELLFLFPGVFSELTVPSSTQASMDFPVTVTAPGGTLRAGAIYFGNIIYGASTAELVTTVVRRGVAVTAAGPLRLRTPGTIVAQVASLDASTGYAPTPTGTLAFLSGGDVIGTRPLQPAGPGVATASFPLTPANRNSITIAYAGDTFYVAGTSAPLSVDRAIPEITFTSVPADFVYGNTSTFGVQITYPAFITTFGSTLQYGYLVSPCASQPPCFVPSGTPVTPTVTAAGTATASISTPLPFPGRPDLVAQIPPNSTVTSVVRFSGNNDLEPRDVTAPPVSMRLIPVTATVTPPGVVRPGLVVLTVELTAKPEGTNPPIPIAGGVRILNADGASIGSGLTSEGTQTQSGKGTARVTVSLPAGVNVVRAFYIGSAAFTAAVSPFLGVFAQP